MKPQRFTDEFDVKLIEKMKPQRFTDEFDVCVCVSGAES